MTLSGIYFWFSLYCICMFRVYNSKLFLADLRELSLLLAALPPTQVSVERLFSALKILKSDHRNRLGEKMINAMLFLRSNM